MAWVSVHQDVDGAKLRRLYKTIGCSKFEALGILNFLWMTNKTVPIIFSLKFTN